MVVDTVAEADRPVAGCGEGCDAARGRACGCRDGCEGAAELGAEAEPWCIVTADGAPSAWPLSAPLAGLPWPASSAVTTPSPVRNSSALAPVATPLRKLISSSRALMASWILNCACNAL